MRIIGVVSAVAAVLTACLLLDARPARAAGLAEKFTNGFCQERFDAAKDQAFGIDVSDYQGDVGWSAINSKTGVLYAFLRASYGLTADKSFPGKWAGAGKECLLRGAYHYFVEIDDPAAQAEKLYQTLKAAGATNPELPVIADIERGSAVKELCNDSVRAKSFVAKAYAFITAFEDLWGQRMMIYTSASFWNCLPDSGRIARNRELWVAEYTTRPSPEIPAAWSKWRFWQFNDKGRIVGIDGDVDADRFNGSGADLLEFAKAGTTR